MFFNNDEIANPWKPHVMLAAVAAVVVWIKLIASSLGGWNMVFVLLTNSQLCFDPLQTQNDAMAEDAWCIKIFIHAKCVHPETRLDELVFRLVTVASPATAHILFALNFGLPGAQVLKTRISTKVCGQNPCKTESTAHVLH